MLQQALRMPNSLKWRLEELAELFTFDLSLELDLLRMDLGMQATNPYEHELDQCLARVELERIEVMPKFFKRASALAAALPSRLGGLFCLVFGHKVEDQGYATPDSGCIEMVCTRCGKDYGRTWLY